MKSVFYAVKKRKGIILVLILIAQILNLIYWGNLKSGYQIDEIFSYTASNFQESECLIVAQEENFAENWHDKQYLQAAFTVQASDRFSYGNVYYKQSLDVHPPLFYFGVHTMSSLFPEQFSKWFGIIPNIIYFAITIVVLYMLGNRMKFFGGRCGGLLLALAYGFSVPAINSVVFIRMYALMTMWAVLACYFHLRIYEEYEKLRWIIAAAIVLFLGLLTQYYFIIFQFFISAFCFINYCCNKKWKSAIIYAISMCSGIGFAVLYYPSMLKHIFSGYRGTQAFENLSSGGSNIKSFLDSFNEMMFHSWGVLFILLILLGLIIAVKKKKLVFDCENRSTLLVIGTMIFCVCGYILIVGKIAPYADMRYVILCVPMIVTVFVWALSYAVGMCVRNTNVCKICIGTVALLLALAAYKDGQVDNLYMEDSVLEENVSKDVVVIYEVPERWRLNSQILLDLQSFSRVYFLPEEKIETLGEVLKACSEECMIVVRNDERETEVIDKVNAIGECTVKSADDETPQRIGAGSYHMYNVWK